MSLRFSSACTDCRPTDQSGQVLGGDRIEHFGGCRHPHLGYFQKNPAGSAQTFTHITTAVHIRIINQAFPADCRSWFFKIDSHYQQHAVGNLGLQFD